MLKLQELQVNLQLDLQNKMNKFRLQYWDSREEVLSIQWAFGRKDYVSGDCYVRAIAEETDVNEHNARNHQNQKYSEPLTLDEARKYVEDNVRMLGEVHDCLGLRLEEKCEVAEFSAPIVVRNIE